MTGSEVENPAAALAQPAQLAPSARALWVPHALVAPRSDGITLELLRSDAWRSHTISTRKLADLLVEEFLEHGENGKISVLRRQLDSALSPRLVPSAIDWGEFIGLWDIERGRRSEPNVYTLTWLPRWDGEPATDRWRCYVNPRLADR